MIELLVVTVVALLVCVLAPTVLFVLLVRALWRLGHKR